MNETMAAHDDSKHGYIHFRIEVENAPHIKAGRLLDELCEVVGRYCGHGDGQDCTIEHYESSAETRCLFTDDGDPMGRHRRVTVAGR